MVKFYNLLKKGSLLAIILGSSLSFAQYANGVLIANEGNYGQPNADVSYFNPQNMQVTNNVYQTVNNENLGDVLQNIGIYDEKAYLVLNNSNKIVIVDKETFVKETVITTNIAQPRYITFSNDKYYVTSSSDKNVSIFNISDNSYVGEIEVGTQVEEIQSIGNNVFVQNGWFGSGNNIVVVDATTDQTSSNIAVEEGINGIKADNGYLYAISSSTAGEYTHIYKINGTTAQIEEDVRFTSVVGGKKITVSDDLLFFVASNSAYALPTSLEGEPVMIATVPNVPYSTFYGFNVIGDYLFSGDASSFTAPSLVKIFNANNGQEVTEFNTTMGTNAFYDNGSSLSVNDVNNTLKNVSIYPNPVVDYAKINGVENAVVSVFDIRGRKLKTVKYSGDNIFLGDLNTGLYFLVIESEGSSITKKVLVK